MNCHKIRPERNNKNSRPAFAALLFFCVCFIAPSSANNSREFALHSQFDHFSYSGAMAVFGLANDWRGTFRSGKDGILDQRFVFSALYNDIEIGYSHILYHQYEFPNDLARGFYYYNNNVKLDSPFTIDTYLKAQSYSGRGLTLAYPFQFSLSLLAENLNFSFKPRLNWFHLDYLVWGEFNGELTYLDNKNWGGTIDLDYRYSKDFVLRRPLENDPSGELYSFDLEFKTQWSSGEFNYSGRNLYALIDWPKVPHSFGRVTTEGPLALYAREGFDKDFSANPPALHYAELKQNLYSDQWQLLMDARHTSIRDFYRLGFRYLGDNVSFSVRQDVQHNSVELALSYQGNSLWLQSQTWDVSQSQQLTAGYSFSYSF